MQYNDYNPLGVSTVTPGSAQAYDPATTLALMHPGATAGILASRVAPTQDGGLTGAQDLSRWGVRPTTTPIGQVASQPTPNFDFQWGVMPTNSPILQDLRQSQQAESGFSNALNNPAQSNPYYIPQMSQDMGVRPGVYNGPNAVQANQQSFSTSDPRMAALAAYNSPTVSQGPQVQPGIGGTSVPQPQQPPTAPSGPYNGGAWTATGNPYSAPGTKMGQYVPYSQLPAQVQGMLASKGITS